MDKYARFRYQPCIPLGADGRKVTGSPEHAALSRKAAGEGMVLLKNRLHTLPLTRGTRVALFGKATIEYIKGGGGSTLQYRHGLDIFRVDIRKAVTHVRSGVTPYIIHATGEVIHRGTVYDDQGLVATRQGVVTTKYDLRRPSYAIA